MYGLELPPQIPSTDNPISRAIGRFALRASGWRIAGEFPDLPRFVLVVAPHTSAWDFFVGLAAKWALDLRVVWIGKRTLFRWPVAGFLRRIGGIAVDRERAHGMVARLVEEFRARDQMVFALTPEGTRKRVEHWRSGYWHVARDAEVPIVPVGLDFGRKTIWIGKPVTTTQSLDDDEKQLRGFFAYHLGRRPENYVV